MAFGTDGPITRKTSYKVKTDPKTDNVGNILEYTTFGGEKTVEEEVFSATFENQAVNGQQGATDIVTGHDLIEDAEKYSRESLTKLSALPAGTP